MRKPGGSRFFAAWSANGRPCESQSQNGSSILLQAMSFRNYRYLEGVYFGRLRLLRVRHAHFQRVKAGSSPAGATAAKAAK